MPPGAVRYGVAGGAGLGFGAFFGAGLLAAGCFAVTFAGAGLLGAFRLGVPLGLGLALACFSSLRRMAHRFLRAATMFALPAALSLRFLLGAFLGVGGA